MAALRADFTLIDTSTKTFKEAKYIERTFFHDSNNDTTVVCTVNYV